MTEAAKEARREYYRVYYQKHRKERLDSVRRYWERRAEKEKERRHAAAAE